MQVLPAKAKTKRKFYKKVFEMIKESKWRTSCKYMWIKRPWNASELVTYVSLKVQININIKIKITHKVL